MEAIRYEEQLEGTMFNLEEKTLIEDAFESEQLSNGSFYLRCIAFDVINDDPGVTFMEKLCWINIREKFLKM